MDVADVAGLCEVMAHMAELQHAAAPRRSAYLLLQDRGQPPLDLPTELDVVAGGPGFRLIRIYRPGESGRSAADACPPRRSQSSMRIPS
jgi:hypothetical protein